MALKESKCLTCSDGTMYPGDHRKDAQRHEAGLEILKILMENFRNDGELKKIAMTIAKEFETFAPVFTQIRRINSKSK
jgi:hypothetical protein